MAIDTENDVEIVAMHLKSPEKLSTLKESGAGGVAQVVPNATSSKAGTNCVVF